MRRGALSHDVIMVSLVLFLAPNTSGQATGRDEALEDWKRRKADEDARRRIFKEALLREAQGPEASRSRPASPAPRPHVPLEGLPREAPEEAVPLEGSGAAPLFFTSLRHTVASPRCLT